MKRRGSGVLLHPTSLPSAYGIGDMGPCAYRFADFLDAAKQSYWQILPLNPTDQGIGNSPYSSPSAFAGNTLLISPELLVESGFLASKEVTGPFPFPEGRCDFGSVIPFKAKLFDLAYERFKGKEAERALYDEFCSKNERWIEDFALFMVIKNHFSGRAWWEWDQGLRERNQRDLVNFRELYHDQVEKEKFLQYVFFRQWLALRSYCGNKGVKLIGDIPIYVNYDSVEVWTHPEIFKLDEEGNLTVVAGVPPDYFSKTGQLWGNPIYRWDLLQRARFPWWFDRIGHNFQLFDILRIDHFRGFVGFWEVPATEKTAIHGRWVQAPALDFFEALLERYPVDSFIAEDLGYITEDVKEIMNRFGFPGMRILQFGFEGDPANHPYLPHNFIPNCVAYTGSHDNNTLRGWFERETKPEDKRNLCRYIGREVSGGDVSGELIRILMMSVANTVIVPVQDLLGLGEEARMNRPSTPTGNWEWRLLPDQMTQRHADLLEEWTSIYGRASDHQPSP